MRNSLPRIQLRGVLVPTINVGINPDAEAQPAPNNNFGEAIGTVNTLQFYCVSYFVSKVLHLGTYPVILN